MDCIFCKIINNEIPCLKVYEDEVCLAFLDINPDCDGHTLIVPKSHYKDIYDIPENVLLHIQAIAKKIMKKLEEKLNCDGFSLVRNNGDIQEVKHYHLHIKPYYNNKKTIEIIKNNKLISNPEDILQKLNK